jgi:hypothetical protein
MLDNVLFLLSLFMDLLFLQVLNLTKIEIQKTKDERNSQLVHCFLDTDKWCHRGRRQ